MKRFLGLFVGLTVAQATTPPIHYSSICPSSASESWMDMSSWFQAGTIPKWEVLNGGRTLKQYINSPSPGFYVSDEDDIIDVVIKGTIQVEEQKNSDGTAIANDNDFIGFGMGMKGPLPWNRFFYDGMLFSWGGEKGPSDWLYHPYWTFTKLNGTIPPTGQHCRGEEGACFWFRTDGSNPPASCQGQTPFCDYSCNNGVRESVGCYALADRDSPGWKLNSRYSFAIQFTEDDFKVSIDGEVRLALTQTEALNECLKHAVRNATATENCKTSTGKAWRKGRIAWYNLSQHGVIYGNIRRFRIVPGQPSNPLAGHDLFGVSRTAGKFTTPLTVDFYVGLLANDWSPKLLSLEAVIAPTFTDDPKVTPAAGGVGTCEHGSTIAVQANGAFTYTPDADLTRKANVDKVSSETCLYRVKDSSGDWSEMANITFALEPESLVCPPEGCFTINWEEYQYDKSWYSVIDKNDEFGQVVANGTCVRIVDWLLPDGGAGGRFTFSGNKIVAKRPESITSEFLVRTIYKMKVVAVDIFGLTAETTISITIPAQCEEQHKCICPNGFSCECNFGFAGEKCEVCDSSRKNVSINPNCTLCADCPLSNPPAAATVTGPCLYPEGQCDVFCTRNITCNAHGDCNEDPANAGECICDPQWAGATCDVCNTNYYNLTANCSIYCDKSSCNGHGSCNPVSGLCDCTPPLGGADCTDCSPPYYPPGSCDEVCDRAQNCSGNGECGFDVNGYPNTCNCDADWIGPWTVDGCNISCTRAACSGHGECNKNDAGGALGVCLCDKRVSGVAGSGNWEGDICDVCETDWYPSTVCDTFCTKPFTCKDRGTCDSNGLCVCDDPVHWTGANCSICVTNWYPENRCDVYCEKDANCSGRGTCNQYGGCDCDEGYQGLDCSVCKLDNYMVNSVCVYCSREKTCSMHGDCNNNATCMCDPDWGGTNCSIPCSRGLNCTYNGECNTDTLQCECDPTFVTETDGSCEKCIPNYFPPRVCNVFCEPALNCSSNGQCSWIDGSCVCSQGWDGDNCSIPVEPPVQGPVPVDNTTNPPTEGNGAASDDSSCPIEIGGTCLLWLIILLSVLFCCLLMLALYYFLRKKKKQQKPPQAQADQALLGEWGAGDINGMDPNEKKAPEPEPEPETVPAEPEPGVNFNMDLPPSPKDDGMDFGPAGLDGMDPNNKRNGVMDFGPADLDGMDPNKKGDPTADDSLGFGPADLGGMDPVKAAPSPGTASGPDFGPADLGGMDPVRGAPGNDFGPADLAGLAPLAVGGMMWNAGNTDGMEPLHREAMEKGKVAAAARELQPPIDNNGNRVTPPWKKNLDNKLKDFDQATDDCRAAAKSALASPGLSADGKKALENMLNNDWGPADMSLMDPLAKQAIADGKTGAILADAMKSGALAPVAGQLEGPLKNWEVAAAALAGAAGAAAGSGNINKNNKDLLKSVDDGSPDKTSFSKLVEPSHVSAAAIGKVPAAVEDVLKGGSVPAAAAKDMLASSDALKKKDAALEKAMRDVASNEATPQHIKDEIGSALIGNWGPADLNDMDPLSNAVKAGALAAVSREALRQPGVPANLRKKMEEALRNNDKARSNVVKAAAAASTNSAVPAPAQMQLKNALSDQNSIRSMGDHAMVKEALGRGKPVAAAEQMAKTDPAMKQSTKEALQKVKSTDEALRQAVANMQPGEAKGYLDTMLNDGNVWGPPDSLSDMDANAIKHGKAPIAVRNALKQMDMNAADKQQLENALSASDTAAVGLNNAMKTADCDFGAPDADAMSQMDPLQRAGMARGQLPVAVNAILSEEPSAGPNLQDKLREAAMAEEALLKQVRANCEDPSMPQHAKKLLEDAVNDTWGPATDLSGMDPVSRNAMSKGQVAAAVGAVLSQPDVPVNMRKKLQAAYDEANSKHESLREAAQQALKNGAVAQPDAQKKLKSALDLNFDGNVSLDGMAPLQKAAQSGMVPVAVRNILKGNQHGELQETMKAFETQETKFSGTVRDVISKMDLPADAKKQLEDGLDGKLSFVYGAADMSGMNPMKGALEQSVRGVLKKGGLGTAATVTLDAAVTEMAKSSEYLETTVRQAIKGTQLNQSAKEELQDALYGKARLNDYNFTAADLDLNSDDFAPLGHAVAGGLPGLGPDFMKNDLLGGKPPAKALRPAGLGNATMESMLPTIKPSNLAAPPPTDDLLGGKPPSKPSPDSGVLL